MHSMLAQNTDNNGSVGIPIIVGQSFRLVKSCCSLPFTANSPFGELDYLSTWLIKGHLCVMQADRERITQLLFEHFNVAGLYLGEQGVLSTYTVGKTTGTVIDLGHGKTGQHDCVISMASSCTAALQQVSGQPHAHTNELCL